MKKILCLMLATSACAEAHDPVVGTWCDGQVTITITEEGDATYQVRDARMDGERTDEGLSFYGLPAYPMRLDAGVLYVSDDFAGERCP